MEMNKYIEPTKEHEGQTVEVSSSIGSWVQRKLLTVLPPPQIKRFICESLDNGAPNPQSHCSWTSARISVLKTPEELHKESGLKEGDWVKVLPLTEDSKIYIVNHYGSGVWGKARDMTSKICQIVPGTSSRMFAIRGEYEDAELPCFVLEKADPPAQPDNEIVHVPGTVEHWIYKGHAYRMVTKSDVNKRCIVSDRSVKDALQRMSEQVLTNVDSSLYLYRTGCAGWKYALIQDDSLLKSALKEEYVPYTWEDRHQLRGKWYRWKSNGCETPVGKMSQDSKSGALLVDYIDAQCLFNNATHLDEYSNDTGIPFGKKVVR